MIIDSHVNLHAPQFAEDQAEVIDRARAAGVGLMVTICDRVSSFEAVHAIAMAHDDIWATVGTHPHEAKENPELRSADLIQLAARPKVVGIGECGLDFHYDHSPREAQRRVFAEQIALAHEHDLALVIHTREAWIETFDILAAEGIPERTVFHCFTGGPEQARRGLDLGIHLSFSGIVTFPSAPEVRAAAAMCPLDHLMVETDAPYLAPVPHRGQPNRPALVAVVGAQVAEVRGVGADVVAAASWANAERFYRLDG
jgi:TatD DNase family protein